MKAVRLIVRTKNNHLVKFRESKGFNQLQMAEYCNIRQQTYASIENLYKYPVNKKGWNEDAKKLSAIVGMVEEELFPEAFERIKKTRIEYEVGLDQLPVPERMLLDGPLEQLSRQELVKKVSNALDSLLPREKLVLEELMGMNGKPKTKREVARELGICSQRVAQIEHKALRKLRHPGRLNAYFSEELKEREDAN